jgi:hypothetical protein
MQNKHAAKLNKEIGFEVLTTCGYEEFWLVGWNVI